MEKAEAKKRRVSEQEEPIPSEVEGLKPRTRVHTYMVSKDWASENGTELKSGEKIISHTYWSND